MPDEEVSLEDSEAFRRVRQRIADRSKEILSKQAVKIAKQAEEHERFIHKDRKMFF